MAYQQYPSYYPNAGNVGCTCSAYEAGNFTANASTNPQNPQWVQCSSSPDPYLQPGKYFAGVYIDQDKSQIASVQRATVLANGQPLAVNFRTGQKTGATVYEFTLWQPGYVHHEIIIPRPPPVAGVRNTVFVVLRKVDQRTCQVHGQGGAWQQGMQQQQYGQQYAMGQGYGYQNQQPVGENDDWCCIM